MINGVPYDREADRDDIPVVTDWATSTAALEGDFQALPRSAHEAVIAAIVASGALPPPSGEKDRSLRVLVEHWLNRDAHGPLHVWQAHVVRAWKVDAGTVEETHVSHCVAIGTVDGTLVDVRDISVPERRVYTRRYGMSAAEYYALSTSGTGG